jgi:moderate conductance mechanosensitive channel
LIRGRLVGFSLLGLGLIRRNVICSRLVRLRLVGCGLIRLRLIGRGLIWSSLIWSNLIWSRLIALGVKGPLWIWGRLVWICGRRLGSLVLLGCLALGGGRLGGGSAHRRDQSNTQDDRNHPPLKYHHRVPVYATVFPLVSLLHRSASAPSFLRGLDQEWLSDIQEFLHTGLPKLIFIALYASVLILVVNFVTGRVLKVAERRDTLGVVRGAQLRTLATVIRATGIVIVALLAILQVMDNVLHLNLSPLLASAGVAGVAIGLAAQTIVKDVLNGILILLEDQYNVGDVVTLAGMTGTVDSMTLRLTTVRGFDGTIYLIPNSQITNVANQSRDYSVSTLNVSVDFSANPDEVIPLLKQIALEVRNEPAFKDAFVADPQVFGVDSIKGTEVIYPIQLRTLPRKQFDAMREMQRRIRLALEQHNLLPGSPYRVLSGSGQTAKPETEAPKAPDPTMAKPNETNPFTGE